LNCKNRYNFDICKIKNLYSLKYITLLKYIVIVWLIIKEGNNDKRYDKLQRLKKEKMGRWKLIGYTN